MTGAKNKRVKIQADSLLMRIAALWLFALLMSIASPVFAATYTLPGSIGSGPFSSCSGSGTVYNCSDDVDFNNKDVVILSTDITLNISGDIDFKNDFELVSGGNLLELNVTGDVDFGNNAIFTGNINADGDVDIGNNTEFVGDVVAGGDIDIGNNGDFTGDLTAGGEVDIGNNTTVDGVCNPSHPQCTGGSGGNPPSIEAGRVTLYDTFTTPSARDVCFTTPFATPPMVFSLPTDEGSDPVALRISNVTTAGFTIVQVEPDGSDGPHVSQTVDFIAIEPGDFVLDGGVNLEVGSFSISNHQGRRVAGANWFDANFSGSFSAAPAIIAEIQTLNNETETAPPDPSRPFLEVAIRNVSSVDFDLALERAETNNGTISSAETVAYLAIEAGQSGTFNTDYDFESIRTPDSVNGWDNNCNTYSFSGSYAAPPLVVASQNSRDGGDGGWLRRCSLNSSQLGLTVDEDQDNDSERNHTTEIAGVFVLSGPVTDYTNSCGVVSTLDHFEINVGAGNGSVCSPFEFTLTAKDAADATLTGYSGTVVLTTSSSNGDFATVTATNNTVPNPDADDNGNASYTFDPADGGIITLSLANTHAETLTITATDGSIPVSTVSAPVSFSENAFVITDTDALVASDNIAVAGRNHSYRIEMVKQDPSTGACGVATDYAGAIPLKQWRSKNAADPSGNQPLLDGAALPDAEPAAENGNIMFTAGVADVELATSDIGKYTLELADVRFTSDPANAYSDSVIAGTSIEQIIRPFGIGIDFSNLRDADFANGGLDGSNGDISFAVDADGSLFTQAGEDFSITVSGALWEVDDDTDNDGVADVAAYLGNNPAAPSFGQEGESVTVAVSSASPGSAGAITVDGGGAIFNSFAAGSQTATMTYSEVGIMSLSAGLAGGDYFGSGVNVTGEAPNVGRFNPAFFQITPENGMLLNSCLSGTTPFTYIGQSFGYDAMRPGFLVTAMNALPTPTITQNYTGVWAKLSDASVSLTAPISDATQVGSDTTTLMTASYTQDTNLYNITDNGDGTLNFEFGDDEFVYDKDANSEISEFSSDINLEVTAVVDSDGVSTASAFTLTPDPVRLRFGRISMSNIFGSELIGLQMPMTIEYFTGGFYQTNSDDSCTAFNNADIVVVADNLSIPGSSTITVTNPTAIAGDLGISLTAPGEGITGRIDLSAELDAGVVDNQWLQYDWNGDGVFNNDPTASATFGIFSGNDVNIYIQQLFQ